MAMTMVPMTPFLLNVVHLPALFPELPLGSQEFGFALDVFETVADPVDMQPESVVMVAFFFFIVALESFVLMGELFFVVHGHKVAMLVAHLDNDVLFVDSKFLLDVLDDLCPGQGLQHNAVDGVPFL